MSETLTPTNGSKKRKVAAPSPSVLGKETLPLDNRKKQLSSLRLESTTQEYLPAIARKQLSSLHENADLWDADTVKARKAAVEVTKAVTSHIDLSCFDNVDGIEVSEMLMLHAAQMAACARNLQEKCLKDAALSAKSHSKIIQLTQDLEEAQSEIKLEKINQEISERLVDRAKQEKHIVELKFAGEKALFKRKIEELETELQQQKNRFKEALLDAEVDGYSKCVKRAKEKGLRYKKLLLDPVHDPIGNRQVESLVHPSAENSRDMDNVPDSSTTVPIGTDSTATIPTVSSEEKALFDPADPMFYNSIIEVLAKKNLEDNGTLKPTSSSVNISENYKQLKDCKTELSRIKKAAFTLGYNSCAQSIGEGSVYDPSKHNLQSFVAWEFSLLELEHSIANAEHKWEK